MYRISDLIWQGGYRMTMNFATHWDAGVRWLINLDLPSGELADDVAVVYAHRRRMTSAKRRIDLLAGEA